MYANKEITEEQVLLWDYKNIIHPDFMVDNKEITDQFIQNLNRKQNKVHNLTGEMKKSFKSRDWKQISFHKYTKSHASLTGVV